MATGTVTESATEAVAEVAEAVSEESGEFADVVRQFTRRDARFLILGVAIGTVGGYFVLNQRIKTKYDRLADEEIAGMREHYNRKLQALDGEEEKKALEITAREGYKGDPRQDGGPVPYHKAGEEPEIVIEEGDDETRNAVEDNRVEGDDILALDPEWDYAKEIKSRRPDVPYVIHADEYKEGPNGPEEYEKVTLTYFAGDDVLCDIRDQVIEDQDAAIGLGNLSRFGHGSGDPNSVYIRNDEMKADIEVVRSDGKYATEVHGFQDDELQHSSMRRRLPRRSEYDDMER